MWSVSGHPRLHKVSDGGLCPGATLLLAPGRDVYIFGGCVQLFGHTALWFVVGSAKAKGEVTPTENLGS